jgi:uncharacterized protein (TIGR00369 family)
MTATRAELERRLAGHAFTGTYGFRLLEAGDGECALEVPFQPAFERAGGIVAGPVFVAAADAAMWLAIVTRPGAPEASVTIELTTAFLAPLGRESFRCRARVLRWGRRLVYGVAECTTGEGRLLTHHTLTYSLPPPD